jgi:hypothetical protein
MDDWNDMQAEIFAVIKGQCNNLVRSRLTAAADFEQLEEDSNVVELLHTRIRNIVGRSVDGQYSHWLLAQDIHALLHYRMEPTDSIHVHAAKWKELLKNITTRWGAFGPTKLEAGQDIDEEQAKFQACLFLYRLDRSRYGRVTQELNNDFLLTQQGYPKSIDDAVLYLDGRIDHKPNTQRNKRGNTKTSNTDGANEGIGGTSFQQTDSASGNDDTDEITDAQFHQYCASQGISFHDFSFPTDDDSHSEHEVDWCGSTPKKNKQKRKGRKN